MDRFGQTPLHHAARISAQNVKILLEGGANSDLMDNSGTVKSFCVHLLFKD